MRILLLWVLLMTPGVAFAQVGSETETETESETETETESETETETETESETETASESESESEEGADTAEEDETDMYVESSTRPIRRPTLPDAITPVSAARLSYWQRGEPRWFISGLLDIGYLFLRPRFQFGYGRPHWSWLGLEINPLLRTSLLGGYVGLRADFPFIEFRIGGRYVFTFQQSFLEEANSYDQLAIESRAGPPSRYLSLEAQIEFKIPMGPGDFRSEVTGTYIALVDDGFYIYENVLRLVAKPPWVWGATAGYRISFGPNQALYVQPTAELVHLVRRDAFLVRAGGDAGAQLWPDLEVRLRILPQVYGPDQLSDQGGNTLLVGIRYRFATDAPNFDD